MEQCCYGAPFLRRCDTGVPHCKCKSHARRRYVSKAWERASWLGMLVPDHDMACLTPQALGSHRRERDPIGGVTQDEMPLLMMRELFSAPCRRTGRFAYFNNNAYGYTVSNAADPAFFTP